ncbi:MAG TPA: HAD-IA family hydrolase [Verrucomicrobiae bacterium]|nr:HAD-IA family hydrolase [Verrucomicrobiae bacterium]
MGINPSIKAVIFDLDGTLVDLPIDWEAVKYQAGKRADQSFGDRVEELIDANNSEILQRIADHEMASLDKAHISSEIAKVLSELDHTYRLAILTRNSRQVAERFLELCGINSQRYLIVGREDISRLKPHPEGLEIILKQLHINPSEAVMVGDTFHDTELAHQNGLYSVLVGNKTEAKHSDKAFQADNLSDVVAIIHNINKEEA